MELLYIKRCDAFNNATLGTHLGFGAAFLGIPNFPHGLYGLVITHNTVIGKNVTIYHQVTIGEGKRGVPRIGDDVLIGTGCIVTEDVPEDVTIVMGKPRIILKR